MTSDSPRIEAFVLRFVFDGAASSSDAAPWRGVVVRVQDNTEQRFVDFADAVAFIARDIRIGDFVFSQGSGDDTAK